MFLELRRDRSEPRAPSKRKDKKHTFVGSSSSRRSSSIMIHLLSLNVFIHRNNLHIFNLHMVIHNYMVMIHHFLIMVCHISFKCILHHQCITHLYLLCTLLFKYILHINYMKTKVKILLFLNIFLDKGHENQVKNALK
ncbi:hypothetical protein Gotur_005797, partial [Gossypium turneri]